MSERPTPSEPTERIAVRDERPSRDVRRRVRRILTEGGLVAMPTETVYGIAVRADDDAALARLRAVKGRPPRQPLSWHVGTREAVGFAALLPLARRLVERYWPGPLTLVLRGVPRGLERVASDGWTGVRLPAHRATAALLAELDFPVVLSSANASGDAPLVDADAVLARFGGQLDLVLDGGRARLGEASEVVRLGPGRFELLRPGLLPIEDLRRTAGLRIAFVCTGNTCRSPMAEALAKALLQRRLAGGADVPITLADFGFEVTSMGVHAGAGSPAAQHAQEVVRARGLDLSEHRSRPAIPERVRAFDRVYCLTASHLDALAQSLPPGAARHVSLLDPRGEDVPDPIGGSVADYERCADLIQRALEQRVTDWA